MESIPLLPAVADILRIYEASFTRMGHLLVLQGLPLNQLFFGGFFWKGSHQEGTIDGPFELVHATMSAPGAAPAKLSNIWLLTNIEKPPSMTMLEVLGSALPLVKR
jgi:hypothetical protein